MVPAVVENPTGKGGDREAVSQSRPHCREVLAVGFRASVSPLASGLRSPSPTLAPDASHPCSPCFVGLCGWGLGLEGRQVSLRFWVCHEKLKDDSLVLKNRKPFLARQAGFTPPGKQPRVGENPSLDHCGKPPDGSRRKPPLGHPRNNKHTS